MSSPPWMTSWNNQSGGRSGGPTHFRHAGHAEGHTSSWSPLGTHQGASSSTTSASGQAGLPSHLRTTPTPSSANVGGGNREGGGGGGSFGGASTHRLRHEQQEIQRQHGVSWPQLQRMLGAIALFLFVVLAAHVADVAASATAAEEVAAVVAACC